MKTLERLIYYIEQNNGKKEIRETKLLSMLRDVQREHEEELRQVKSVDLADVGERYLAIGTLASGKSFRYEDNAVDMRAFANYINEIYPDFEVDAIIAT